MLIDLFLGYLRSERNYSERTIVSYGTDLREFEAFFSAMDEGLKWETVDSDLVRLWIMHLVGSGKEGLRMQASSVNRKLSSLRSFYRFLMIRGYVQINPMSKVKGLKKKKALPSFVREADMERLLESSFGDDFEGCRDKAILDTFYSTGIRLSELIGLNEVDVDFRASQIKVTGKRNKQRLIPFGEELRQTLLIYIKVRDEALPTRITDAFFVRKNGMRMYSMLVYKLVRKNLSKVTALKKRSPHVLRHTFATSMLNHSAELESVKELLGHQSLATTEIYTHTTFEELKQIYKQAHPRA